MVALGIDIGGTGIKGAPVDCESGALVAERFRIETPSPATPSAVAEVVGQVAKQFSWTGPIGCGFPAIIKKGSVHSAANIDKAWIGENAAARFSTATNCPVTIINDADAAGLAEMKFGAGKDEHGVVALITLGTGIGTAVFTDGHLVENVEIGHLVVRGKDAEKRASNGARERRELSWKKWGKNVNEYLAEIERLLNPSLFIIGGGVSKKWDKFAPYIKLTTRIVPATMLNDAGIVGAALATVRTQARQSAFAKVGDL